MKIRNVALVINDLNLPHIQINNRSALNLLLNLIRMRMIVNTVNIKGTAMENIQTKLWTTNVRF